MNWQDYIEEKPGVMMGKPVFKGTRITVEHVLRELGRMSIGITWDFSYKTVMRVFWF